MDASMLEGSTSIDLMKPERPAQWPNPKLGSILVWIDEITSFLYPKAALEPVNELSTLRRPFIHRFIDRRYS
jgi:hypothetical protein